MGKHTMYLKDYGGEHAVVYGGETDQYWEVQPLNDDNIDKYYFGVAPSEGMKVGNYYYTTLYTTFAYKLKDGVKAYIVTNVYEGGSFDTTEVNGIVPAETPVLLACRTNYAKGNRLVPTTVSGTAITGDNKLVGVLGLYNGSSEAADYRIANSTDKLVLTTDGSNLVFKHIDTTDGFLPNNTAYIPASAVHALANAAKRSSKGNGINGFKPAEKTKSQEVYDLQGRRVEKPGKGIYIVNGKKVVF